MAKAVLGNRETLLILRAYGGQMLVNTLFFADEIQQSPAKEVNAKCSESELALGELIGQLEQVQSEQIQSQGIVGRIDKEIADLSAKNLVMSRLHASGALNDTDYAQKFAEINNKLTELRKERRRQFSNEEDPALRGTRKTACTIQEC